MSGRHRFEEARPYLLRAIPALVIGAAGVLKLVTPTDSWVVGAEPTSGDASTWSALANVALALAEIGLAALLIVAWNRWTSRAMVCAASLMSLGLVYLAWVRVSGHPDAHCSCFGASIDVSWGKHLALNGVLLGMLSAALFEAGRDPGQCREA